MGVSFDVTGSYRVALMVFCIATFTGAVLMMRPRPYRYQKAASDGDAPELPLVERESQVS